MILDSLSLDCLECGEEIIVEVERDTGASYGGRHEEFIDVTILARHCTCESVSEIEDRAIKVLED